MVPPTESQEEEMSLWKVLIDITLIFVCLPVTLVLVFNTTANKRGYFSSDESLSYTNKSSTVTKTLCIALSMTIPVSTIMAMEMWISRWNGNCPPVRIGEWTIPHWVVRCVRYILLFIYGMESMILIVYMGKVTVGRLRPNFFDVCWPNETWRDFTGKKLTYVEDWTCVGDGITPTNEVSSSFPSAHAALSFYAAAFIVMYLEQRILWPEHIVVTKTIYELAAVMLAWFTALTRIANNKHHWEDVVAGSLLGAAFAWFWVHHVLHLHVDNARRNYSRNRGCTLLQPQQSMRTNTPPQ